jgi:hypothetical protein
MAVAGPPMELVVATNLFITTFSLYFTRVSFSLYFTPARLVGLCDALKCLYSMAICVWTMQRADEKTAKQMLWAIASARIIDSTILCALTHDVASYVFAQNNIIESIAVFRMGMDSRHTLAILTIFFSEASFFGYYYYMQAPVSSALAFFKCVFPVARAASIVFQINGLPWRCMMACAIETYIFMEWTSTIYSNFDATSFRVPLPATAM